jgi:hypothetical protein
MAEDGIKILSYSTEVQSSGLGIVATNVTKSFTLERESSALITYPSLCSICDDKSD